MNISYRNLTSEDRKAYHQLLLKALKDEPLAYGSSYEEELSRPPDKWLEIGINSMTIAAFDNDKMIGTIGVYRHSLKKMIHVIFIKAMYLLPEYRGQGIGKHLVSLALDFAKNKMNGECAKLWVVKDGGGTEQFYEKCGFSTYGIDPKAIRINGKFYDEYLMWKDLSA